MCVQYQKQSDQQDQRIDAHGDVDHIVDTTHAKGPDQWA